MLHLRQRGRQKAGDAHHLHIRIFPYRLHELPGGHVHAQIHHLEAGPTEHNRHNVLSHIVQISAGGTQYGFSVITKPASFKIRLQPLQPGFHGTGTGQYPSNILIVILKIQTHTAHGTQKAVIQNIRRILSPVQSLLHQLGGQTGFSFNYCLLYFIVGHNSLLAFFPVTILSSFCRARKL